MLEAFLGRAHDRRTVRPAGLLSAMDDRVPWPTACGLALQHFAIQSIYLVLPVLMASILSRDPADATRFLCLALLAAALWQVLQLLTRGPVGSGYPIPGTNTAATAGGYLLVAAAGAQGEAAFGTAGALVALTGLAMVLLTFVMRRVRVFLPNEVAGVVVMLIGVGLLAFGSQRLGLQGAGAAPDPRQLGAFLASLAVMAAVALSRTRAVPFAVLIGAAMGIPLALALGIGVPNAAAVLAERPWIAIPTPWAPRFAEVTLAPLVAFLVSIVALKATALGSLVVVQRAADAGWTLPDPRPIRRGLLANGIATMAAGLAGAMCPSPATAAVGLSVATGTLARRIAWLGAGLLVLAALCPKFVALFVLMPHAVQAAMLFYVSGFLMAQGCQLVTARLLDARRITVVAFGLGAGLMEAMAPQTFQAWVPALASPVSFGALVAFLVNLLTLPLMRQRAELGLALDAGAAGSARDWYGRLAGGWGIRARTEEIGQGALAEFVQLLRGRGAETLALTAIRGEDRVELRLAWAGPALPPPRARPHFADLEEGGDAMEGVMVWLATRQAQSFTQRATATGTEAMLILED